MRYPGAKWEPISVNFTKGGCHPRYLVLHIMAGSLAGTDNWFRSHPEAQASSHFGVGKSGEVVQWVDTGDTAWHAAAANQVAIGVEHEGKPPDALTPAQVKATAALFAWVSEHHAVPLRITADPDRGAGLAWHGMGRAAWGDHPHCPGSHIVAQRQAILTAAKGFVNKYAQWSADGKTSLAELAAARGTKPSTILRVTAVHAHYFHAHLATYINGVFAGSISPAEPIPHGAPLFVPVAMPSLGDAE